MNDKLERFKYFIRGRKAAVIGVGISNRPLIKWLYGLGAHITACDRLNENDPSIIALKEEFAGKNITWSFGENYLEPINNNCFDIVFKTPKMRYETPELQKAKDMGAVLTSEMELFMDLCPAQIFGITGSDGKTTTTTIVSEILKQAGYKVYLGGNIGTPLLDQIAEINEDDKVVLELSSFQLLGMKKNADVAIVTNITPNHLDFHKDYDEYIDSKKNIFLNQGPTGKVILNSGNEITYAMKDLVQGRVGFFSSNKENMDKLSSGKFTKAYLDDNGNLVYETDGTKVSIMNENEILIPGKHNVENFLAAILATVGLVSVEDIIFVAKNFPGVQHRIEFIREVDGARWYNSSIDTSPNRTINTMNALAGRNEKGVLICGGADKKCNYEGLGDAILNVCDRIVCYGSNWNFISDILEKEANGRNYQFVRIEDDPKDVYEFPETRDNVIAAFDKVIAKARELANPGDVVIMSNVGTSYDHFRHFEHRGDMFKDMVNSL